MSATRLRTSGVRGGTQVDGGTPLTCGYTHPVKLKFKSFCLMYVFGFLDLVEWLGLDGDLGSRSGLDERVGWCVFFNSCLGILIVFLSGELVRVNAGYCCRTVHG